MNKGKKNCYLKKMVGTLFRRDFYKYLSTIFIIYVSFVFFSAFSAVVVSEVVVSPYASFIEYLEVTNVSNKKLSINSFSITSGNGNIKLTDTVSFNPRETKLIAFPYFSFTNKIQSDSSCVIVSKDNLQMSDKIILECNLNLPIDTFICEKYGVRCIERSMVLIDEEFNPIHSEFQLSTPSPMKNNMKVRMKNLVNYSYDNSGNRLFANVRPTVYNSDNSLEDYDFEIEQEETGNGFDIKVYPNPTEGNVIVDFPEIGNYALRLYDLKSNKLLETTLSESKSTAVEMSHLPLGIYMLSVYESNQLMTTVKIIKK